MRFDSRPATKFSAPLTKPNETTKDGTCRKEDFGTPKSRAATAGDTLRTMPMTDPTKYTCTACQTNWSRLTRMLS